MDRDKAIQIFDHLITAVSLILLIYAFVVVIPTEKALLENCSERVLCENNMLKGRICDKYKSNFTFNMTNSTINR